MTYDFKCKHFYEYIKFSLLHLIVDYFYLLCVETHFPEGIVSHLSPGPPHAVDDDGGSLVRDRFRKPKFLTELFLFQLQSGFLLWNTVHETCFTPPTPP